MEETSRFQENNLVTRAGARLQSKPALLQLIKFCIVGTSSTVIDKGVFWILLNALPLLPWWICSVISFCFGVTNGFLWNRFWTFRAKGEGHSSARRQYAKFVISNIIGLILNLTFTKIFLVIFTGQVWHSANPDPKQTMIASLCAIPFVVIWNFTAAKFWTFRKS
jgi:putative flippase GtrA